jgi:hypothetical protein
MRLVVQRRMRGESAGYRSSQNIVAMLVRNGDNAVDFSTMGDADNHFVRIRLD